MEERVGDSMEAEAVQNLKKQYLLQKAEEAQLSGNNALCEKLKSAANCLLEFTAPQPDDYIEIDMRGQDAHNKFEQ